MLHSTTLDKAANAESAWKAVTESMEKIMKEIRGMQDPKQEISEIFHERRGAFSRIACLERLIS
ncbi:hypothetical protein RLOatenuis_8240 [Rickettsiales bacterium]|nr:hypothetical protein RLOatenuis_8240 [Rickettsiales bacterium]